MPSLVADPSASSSSPRIAPIIYQRLLYDWLYANKWTMLAFLVVIFFTLPVETVVLPRYYSRLFEGIRQGGASLPSLFTQVWKNITSGSVSGVLYLIGGVWVVVVVAYILKNTIEAHIVPSYMSFVRQKLFGGTVDKHSSNYKDLRVGEEVTRIMDVSRNMKDLLCWVLTDLFPIYFATFLLVVYLLWVNPWIGGATLVGVVVHAVLLVTMSRKSVDLSATREHYYLQMSEKLHDSFGNLMNIYLNNMKDDAVKSNNDTEAMHSALMTQQFNYTRNMVALLSGVSVVTFLVTIGVTYMQVQQRNITTPTFVMVWIIILLYLSYMMRLSDNIPNYITKLGIVQCSNTFLTGILQAGDTRDIAHRITDGKVVFQDVHFTYAGNKSPTLHQFTLHVQPNEKVGILGTSGSGKTTAMKLLSGIHKAGDGLVQIDGTNVSDIDLSHLRTQVNYVNQRTQLFNDTILKNIQYGNTTDAKTIDTLLRKYKLDAVYSKLKDGVQTNAGVHGGSLSLGMQKVTMLMRGLLRDGKVMILDEPLAGLDAKTRQKVLQLIGDRCKGKTLLVITHDKEILPMMDRVVNFGELNHTERWSATTRGSGGGGSGDGVESVEEGFVAGGFWLG